METRESLNLRQETELEDLHMHLAVLNREINKSLILFSMCFPVSREEEHFSNHKTIYYNTIRYDIIQYNMIQYIQYSVVEFCPRCKKDLCRQTGALNREDSEKS